MHVSSVSQIFQVLVRYFKYQNVSGVGQIFSRNRQDCTDSISTLVIIEENNKVLSDLPPSYASIFPIRVGIQKNLPANNFMLQQQMTVCGNCMGCIEYNMCMQYQKVMMN